MAQISPLDRVIQVVGADASATADTQRLVIVDTTQRRAVDSAPFWKRSHYRYYRVSNDRDPQHVARFDLPSLQLPDLDHAAVVAVTVQVSCPAGHETQAAEALCAAADSPAQMLERHLARWLLARSRDRVAEFLRSYFDNQDKVHAELHADLFAETGLNVRVRLTFEVERALKPISIVQDHLPIRVHDYDVEQDVKLRVELEVDDAHKVNAIVRHIAASDLEQVVIAGTRQYLREHVSMQMLSTEIGASSIAPALRAHLNGLLQHAGRRVGALILAPKPAQDLQYSWPADIEVLCNIHAMPKPVAIKNKVLMNIENVAQYRAAGSPNLDRWLREHLNRATRDVLFDARYIDLLIRFQPLELRIKETLSEQAHAIGYRIKQLITVPDLAPLKWKEHIAIETRGTFETNLSNVFVKLDIVVRARVPRLEEIEERLNQQQDVPAEMTDVILDVTRQHLHKIHPERFYMRFHLRDEKQHPEEKSSVEAELDRAVRQRLAKEFKADVLDVVLKVVETELMTRLRSLQERICPLEIAVNPFGGGQTIGLTGQFRVVGVDLESNDGWYQYQLSTHGLDEIRRYLEEQIALHLETEAGAVLSYADQDRREQIESYVREIARGYASRQFGLAIEVMSVRRHRTELEIAINDARLDAVRARIRLDQSNRRNRELAVLERDAAKLDEHRRLLQARALIEGQEGTEPEIQELDAKLNANEASLAAPALPTTDEITRALRRTLGAGRGSQSRILKTAEPGIEPDGEGKDDRS